MLPCGSTRADGRPWRRTCARSRVRSARCRSPAADLTDQKQLQAQLAHQDRLASVGRLAAGVAHEIGNPLTGIASVAQNLRADGDPDSVAERVDLILQQTRRIEAIVRSLLRFSH